MRTIGLILASLLFVSCVTERKVYRWLNNHPRQAAEYAAVKFPPRTVQGETKVVKVVDSVEKKVIVRDTVDCPDGTKVVVEKDVQYIVQKEYLHRVDTMVNTAEVEKERLRANEAERDLAVTQGELEVSEDQKKARLYWIIGLAAACLGLLFLLFRR